LLLESNWSSDGVVVLYSPVISIQVHAKKKEDAIVYSATGSAASFLQYSHMRDSPSRYNEYFDNWRTTSTQRERRMEGRRSKDEDIKKFHCYIW
jgi:hypothetical protein